jgi:hypothetical protein
MCTLQYKNTSHPGKQNKITLPKVHNSSITESLGIQMAERPHKEFKNLVLKTDQ